VAKTIFVLEDEVYLLRAVKRLLEDADYEVSDFSDPYALLEALQAKPEPDLILTDHDLGSGVMNGAQFAEEVRNGGYAGPIMMWSGGNPEIPDAVTLFRRKGLGNSTLLCLIEGLIKNAE